MEAVVSTEKTTKKTASAGNAREDQNNIFMIKSRPQLSERTAAGEFFSISLQIKNFSAYLMGNVLKCLQIHVKLSKSYR